MVLVVRSAAATLTRTSAPISRYFRPTTNFRRPIVLNIPIQRSRFGTTFPRFTEHSPIPGSPPPPPPPASKIFLERCVAGFKRTGFFLGSATLGIGLIGAGVFIHDAFTYTDKHVENVPVNPLALKPTTGGPKNLPIASSLVGDEEDDEAKALSKKPRLVIVGGGWGVSFTRFISRFLLTSPLTGCWSLANAQANGLSRHHCVAGYLYELHAPSSFGRCRDCSSAQPHRALAEASCPSPRSFRLRNCGRCCPV